MKQCIAIAAALFLLELSSDRAWALGEERFGNDPLADANYTTWPGIMPLVNSEARVYYSWVNGNEHFYYRGDIAALNVMLKNFAAVKVDGCEVVLRPGAGETGTFRGEEKVKYDWELHLVGGIAGHLTTLDQGDKVWSKHPVLMVYLGDQIELPKLEIAERLTLSGLPDLKKRNIEALEKSSDKTVRGWGCGNLAHLDPFDDGSFRAIRARLKDEDDWVRLNAAGALGVFGARARPALDDLRAAAGSEDENLKAAANRSIESIEAAKDRSEEERAHRARLLEIEKFVRTFRKKLGREK